jgi:hypothetical protein
MVGRGVLVRIGLGVFGELKVMNCTYRKWNGAHQLNIPGSS